MKFCISEEVFDTLGDVCFAVVVAKGVDNNKELPKAVDLLNKYAEICEKDYEGKKVKESPEVKCYRDAFLKMNVNPNKFMCSIEALMTRIAKGKGMPTINAAVDIANSVSLKYKLAIGAHDIKSAQEGFDVRKALESDSFIPFGATETESADVGEIVYASGNTIRTRRWIWRQSELGKITENTTDIFFPIDGFESINKDTLIKARDELAQLIKENFGCEVMVGFVNKENSCFEF